MDSSWKFCSLLLIVLITCIYEGLGIKCWSCRSDYDPSCVDPFDNSSMSISDCNQEPDLRHLPGLRPTMCRKIRQRVHGQWTIIRGCAYLGEPGIDGNEKLCLTKPHINATFMEYCTCNSKDGCNTGPTVYSNRLVVLFAAFLTCFTARFYNQ